MNEGKPPFTVDELMIHTFAPKDGTMYISKEDSALLGVSTEGELIRIDVPAEEFWDNMTDEEYEAIIKKYSK